MRNLKSGFPAGGGSFYNSLERWLDGSVASLRIALDPLGFDASNSLYAVFPTRVRSAAISATATDDQRDEVTRAAITDD
jgi:hypothetical protein